MSESRFCPSAAFTGCTEAGNCSTVARWPKIPTRLFVIVGQILCILVPLVVWFAPLPLEPVTKHGFAIVGFIVVAWITRAMDYALAGLVGCFLFWALGIVKFPVAFSGFANDTAWFLFGALLLGVIATRSKGVDRYGSASARPRKSARRAGR